MNWCPLLLRPYFVGRTYHDFQMKFQSSTHNCTNDATQNLLLIEFTRLVNQTWNMSSYILYDRSKSSEDLPHVQVFHNDHAQLCIRSALETNQSIHQTCHEFYMVTMLSSVNQSIWSLLILFAYLAVLLLAMLVTVRNPWRQTIAHSSVTRKLINNRNLRLFLQTRQRRFHPKKHPDKREFFQVIDSIALDFRRPAQAYTVETYH